MHPEIGQQGVGPAHARDIRQALVTLAAEAVPEADQVVLVVGRGLGDSGLCVTVPADKPRYSALPRTAVCRVRLGRLVRALFPDAADATVVCYALGRAVAAIELPV